MDIKKSKDKPVSWEEFDKMTYVEAKMLIMGNNIKGKSFTKFLHENGINFEINSDEDIYKGYLLLHKLSNTPLGKALK